MATEIKKVTFNKGVQNRDNDPLVVPEGEYIQAINARIARSEGGGVGVLENVLGNESVSDYADVRATVLGAIRDQSENRIYYFVKGSEEDVIFEYDETSGATRALLRDDRGVLNFSTEHLITGVNLIGTEDPDDLDGDGVSRPADQITSNKLLLWTDNFNPPRKINIRRTFARLQGSLNGFTEQEISVEKNPPLFSPDATAVDLEEIVANAAFGAEKTAAMEEKQDIEKEENLKEKFVRFATRWRYEDNEYSVYSPFTPAKFAPGKFEFDQDTGAFIGMENQIKALDISFSTGPREVVEVDLLYKEDNTTTVYVVESFNKADRGWGDNVTLGEIIDQTFTEDQVLDNEDGEAVRVVLNSKLRAQNPIVGVGRGPATRTNSSGELVPGIPVLTEFTIERGEGTAPDYIVFSFPIQENEIFNVQYYSTAEAIRFSSNKLYRALPDSQLARVFDAVPIRAQSQEIIGNRLVYGNYIDRYDLVDILKTFELNGDGVAILSDTRKEDIVVDFETSLVDNGNADTIIEDEGVKSLKSDRDYELGIVYLDALGRQTPVLTSEKNTVNIPIDRANKTNKLKVQINSKAPEWATNYRFFVKQNRGTFYNIIPLDNAIQPDDDRWVWFRLANTDEGKVSEGDYLNLKILGQEYAYLNSTNKVRLKVEEAAVKERNFLELQAPRVGEITYENSDDADDPRNGELLNDGEIYTKQTAGFWIKTKNTPLLRPYVERYTSAIGNKTGSRSNNARRSNMQPIKGSIEDYQDTTYYYPENLSVTEDTFDEESITFGGTYLSSRGAQHFTGTPQLGPSNAIGGNGPMRVQVEISSVGKFRYSWWLSPSFNTPPVIQQTSNEIDIVTGAIAVGERNYCYF